MQNQNDGSNNGGLSWSAPQTQHKDQQGQKPQTQAQPPHKPQVPSQPMLAGGSSTTAKYVGMIVLGVIIGVLIAWGWTAARAPSGGTATTASSTNAGSMGGTGSSNLSGTGATGGLAQGSDSSLTVSSPQKPGMSVAIDKAVVSSPTWIVVYESSNGQPGRALGAALFFPGAPKGMVELLRATQSGKTYLITKQTDNGDKKFSLRNDPILMEGGKPVWVTLEVR